MKKEVAWVKWVDPLIPEEMAEEFEEDFDGYELTRQSFSDGGERIKKPHYTGAFIYGPLGIVPLQHHNLPSKLYNFWMGHTNFNISSSVADTIEKTEGVETLKVFTRYRFWISIGKCFNQEEVKNEIARRLTYEPKIANPKTAAINAIKDYESKQFANWAVIRCKNGKLLGIGDNDLEKVKQRIKDLNGVFEKIEVCSWENYE